MKSRIERPLFFWLLCVATACLALFFMLAALRAESKPVAVHRLWTKAELVDAAAVVASKYDPERRSGLVFIDMGGVVPEKREKRTRALGYVINSLSRNKLIYLPAEAPGTDGALVYFDLFDLKADRADFDRLGQLGSGPAPFPEPYYHAVVEGEAVTHSEREEAVAEKVRKKDSHGRDYTVWDPKTCTWNPEYETVVRTKSVKVASKKAAKKTILGGHLHKATALGLVALTETEFPIFTYAWFVTNALTEPRYHELLGLDDSKASVRKLAALDDELADRVGAKLRGVVIFSEVAQKVRALNRFPTPHRNGRGSYHESDDFKTSVLRDDTLKDLLGAKAAAHEIIFNLPNGLLGFFVTDGADKRLDKADGDVANNKRSKFKDSQVRTAFHCIACHLPDCGWIEIDDEVRALATKYVKLFADSFSKDDPRRGERIREQFLDADYNELVRSDQAIVSVAVRAATGGKNGLTCPETAKEIIDTIWEYTDTDVTLAQLSLELGYPQEDVLVALQYLGIDPVFTVLRAGRKARRDQIEAGFAQVAAVLYSGKYK